MKPDGQRFCFDNVHYGYVKSDEEERCYLYDFCAGHGDYPTDDQSGSPITVSGKA